MFGLSPVELGICVVVIVLLFGTKKLPELGSGLGQAISNFKKGYRDAQAIDVTPKEPTDKSDTTEKKSE